MHAPLVVVVAHTHATTTTTQAANFLDIKPMLDLTCKTVAKMITGKTPEEIRAQFNIQNDFTPAEEEQVRKENAWAEETP